MYRGTKAENIVKVSFVKIACSHCVNFKLPLTDQLYNKLRAETLQRIRERTKLAMQDPKVMSCKNNADLHCCIIHDGIYICTINLIWKSFTIITEDIFVMLAL